MLLRLLAFPALLLLAGLAPAAAPPVLPVKVSRKIDFVRDIQPIFECSCISCHGVHKQRSGLRLDDGTLALQGGDSGAIKPGDSTRSRLIRLATGLDPDTRMPPSKRKALTGQQLSLLRAWIDQGAVWPRGNAVVSGRAQSRHWAFQPIRRLGPPNAKDSTWPRNGIDRFVLARLEKEKIAPSREADRVTLLRRVYLDLVGLPPAPEEVEAFLADSRVDSYERMVDRLLASPAYGERWARHWLDVARYADSDGYEKDTGRPFAWRWRHWVIAALNANLPYDQFTIQQVAGDLLPAPNAKQAVEQKVATGFHRNTLTNREGGVDREQFRVEAVVDRTNTTARVWLGLTLGCAQCHDHKYDPLSHREYYQFFAFFNSDVEMDLPAPLPEDAPSAHPVDDRQRIAIVAKEKALRRALAAKLSAWVKALTADQKKALPAKIRAIVAVEAGKRSAKQNQALLAFQTARDAELARLTKQLADLRKAMPSAVLAQTLALRSPRKTHLMIRGDFLRPGVEVRPGTPAVLPPLSPSPPNHLSHKGRGGVGELRTRLDLARWLVSSTNPLTPRVTANWIWQRYFGRGLVATLEDFGTQGEKPTHPELLDWLAGELIRNDWDVKALHRLIVTSATYRQSSHVRAELLARDPYNTLLARQVRYRLEAEVIRDVSLAASGLLVRRVGGSSVRPPQPLGISELTYAGSARWIESKGPDRYRRGLYTWFQRTSPYPMLMTFDAPDAALCCVRRDRSNTPLQALTLLNDTVFVECAQSLARRVLTECKSETAARLRYAFRLCTARTPTDRELMRLTQLYAELRELCEADLPGAAKLAGDRLPQGTSAAEVAAWVAVARALLNLDEVVTRE